MVQIICTSLHVGAAQTDIKEKLTTNIAWK
jgi:hypothetical protein